MLKFKPRSGEGEYERLAFAEVLIPESPNVYGDYHTRESVRQFAYGFMINGFGIDIDHDNVDVTGKIRIVESFLAREGDPDFVPGAWVVGIYVMDDDIWTDILSGELNGFSYEALVEMLSVELNVPLQRDAIGETYPDPNDGHVHRFWARMDDEGRVLAGGTDVVNGHSHPITSHTYTERNEPFNGHRHRFSVYTPLGDEDDAPTAA